MDYFAGKGALGLELKKDNFAFAANYNLEAGYKTVNQGVFATFRYEF